MGLPDEFYQKVIIFDGPDGTGKTNIARELSRRMKIPYFKFSGEADYWRKGQFRTALEFDQPFMQQFLRQTGHDVVWDRAYPSEWVYSQVFGRKTNWQLLASLDQHYAYMGAWIVVPLRLDYSGNRRDEFVGSDVLPKLHDTYLRFCEWTRCSSLQIYVDTFGNDLGREVEAIAGHLMFDRKERVSMVLRGDR